MSSLLDPGQVLKESFDSTNGGLRVNVVASTQSDLDKVDSPVLIPYSSINGSGGAYYEVKSSLAGTVKQLVVYDTTGLAMNIAVGGSGSEVSEVILGPGVDGAISVNIPSGSRVTIKSAETSAPSSGSVVINFLG